MVVIMTCCMILSFIIAIYLYKVGKYNPRHTCSPILIISAGWFLCLGLAGMIGILAKTFNWWGNSW